LKQKLKKEIRQLNHKCATRRICDKLKALFPLADGISFVSIGDILLAGDDAINTLFGSSIFQTTNTGKFFHFFPLYSLKLNITERLWQKLTKKLIFNKFHQICGF